MFVRSSGPISVKDIPIRLTSKGHHFASDLVKPGVFEKVTKSFKDIGLSEAIKVVFALGKKAIEKKLDQITDDDELMP